MCDHHTDYAFGDTVERFVTKLKRIRICLMFVCVLCCPLGKDLRMACIDMRGTFNYWSQNRGLSDTEFADAQYQGSDYCVAYYFLQALWKVPGHLMADHAVDKMEHSLRPSWFWEDKKVKDYIKCVLGPFRHEPIVKSSSGTSTITFSENSDDSMVWVRLREYI